MNKGEKIYTAKFPITDNKEDKVSDSKMATLGQHNEEILKTVLGIEDEEITRLESMGVIGNRPRMPSK